MFDNLRGKLYVVVHADPAAAGCLWAGPGAPRRSGGAGAGGDPALSDVQPGTARCIEETDFVSGFTREGFEEAVARIKEYIVDGDVMQVVLSQRLSRAVLGIAAGSVPRTAQPQSFALYVLLQSRDFHIVGSSPEILVHVEDGEVTVRPIAGTRPRGATRRTGSGVGSGSCWPIPKSCAEHLMLIDLGPQRRGSRGRGRQRGGDREDGDRALFPRHAYRLQCHRPFAPGHEPDRGLARHFSRRHRSAARPRSAPWRSSTNWSR